MKKAFLFALMVAGLLSCSKGIDSERELEGTPMTFDVKVAETKAVKTSWVTGEKIYVFFNGLETKYLVLEFDGSRWTNTSGGGTLIDTDFSGLDTKTLTAVYFPVAVDVNYADGKFSFTNGGKPVYNYYLYETGKAYTIDGTTVSATLSMGKPADMVQIHVAGIQSDLAHYTFGCKKIKPVACKSVSTDGTIVEDEFQAGARLSGVSDSDGGIFAGRLTTPGVAADYVFTVANDDYIYTMTRNGKILAAGKMYNFPALNVTGGTNWAITAASDLYVDLGLSVKWAKCNIGATTETEFGDYLAWGELNSKEEYSYTNYIFGWDPWSKYTGEDYTTLQKEDDAAYAALGGKFRMPTQKEFEELCSLIDQSTTVDGISGRSFTADNGNRIFIPYNASSNSTGYYWSSTLRPYPTDAYPLYITSTMWYTEGYRNRYEESAVRPVYAE